MSAVLRMLAMLGLLAALPAGAAEYDAGSFVVHYSAIGTEELAPKVAEAYGIARSPTRALLNVSVVRKVPHTTGTPIPAQVSVTAVNQAGQLKPMAMRKVVEPPSLYYLGEVTVEDQETLRFELSILVE